MPHRDDRSTIEDRLALLESENRTLKKGGILIALFFAALFIVAAKSPLNLTAERLVLRDSAGKIGMTLDPKGMTLLDSSGKTRLRIDATQKEDEVRLQLFDRDGKRRTFLYAGEVAGNGLDLQDAEGNNRVILRSNKDQADFKLGT